MNKSPPHLFQTSWRYTPQSISQCETNIDQTSPNVSFYSHFISLTYFAPVATPAYPIERPLIVHNLTQA